MRSLLRKPIAPLLALIFVLSCGSDSTGPGPTPPVVLQIGDIATWAGTGFASYDGDGHTPARSSLYWPMDVTFTPTLGTFILDWNNHRVRKLMPNGKLQTIIGLNIIGDGPLFPDTGGDITQPWPGTECALNHPTQVIERRSGMLLLVAWHNHKLREWDPTTGNVLVTIGRGAGCGGDGGPASDNAARLNQPSHVAEAADGTLYILDQRNQCIRRIDTAGNVSVVVATPVCTDTIPGSFGGDGGAPASASLSFPTFSNPQPGGGLAIDDLGRLYISDTMNNRIRRVDFVADMIVTVAGDGTTGYGGDGGDPLAASFYHPGDIEFGPDGKLYVADTQNHRVRAIDFVANTIVTVAGTGDAGYSGDNGPATSAKLNQPYGVAFDAAGDLYITDTYNHRIRRVRMH